MHGIFIFIVCMSSLRSVESNSYFFPAVEKVTPQDTPQDTPQAEKLLKVITGEHSRQASVLIENFISINIVPL
jgi:hypothetical protein